MEFGNFVQRFDDGKVEQADIEALLDIVYPNDPEARQQRLDRVIVNGEIVKFQAVGLNRQAEQTHRQQLLAGAEPPPPPEPITSLSPDLQKDIPDEVYDHPDYLSEIKARVGIVQAVRTWGKSQAQIKDNRTEGVKVRCPFTHHVDNKPSAWVNTAKNTWVCGKCQVGGDVVDFYAAAKHGLQPSDFHRSSRFHQIIKEMAEELGIQIVSTSDGGFVVEARTESWKSNLTDSQKSDDVPEPIMQPVPTTIVEQTPDGPISYEDFFEPAVPRSPEAFEPITISEDEVLRGLEIEEDIDDEEELFDTSTLPSYDWRRLGVHEDTFLHSWMLQGELELPWVPPEFLLGLGLQAIGIACGHKTTSSSFGLPLTASTLVVLVGNTASGKSTATNRLSKLIAEAVGPKWDRDLGTGVKKITSTASAEALTQRIRTDIDDPRDPDRQMEVPTNAWYLEDELAQLISRSRRSGGEHIKQRIMRFHDFAKTKDEPEMVAEDHSLTGGYRNVHDTYFTATFLTQNEAVRDLAEKKDLVSGFFNRMIFFMGANRQRRLFSNVTDIDPNPDYVAKYERMWKDCQHHARVIPFSDAAARLIDDHPLNDKLNLLARRSDMFARWQMMMLRFSFILAVNENASEVDVRHINASFDFVSSYLIPCAGQMIELAKPETSEKNLLGARIIDYVENHYDKHGQWPEARQLRGHRMWRDADAEIRKRALDLLYYSQELVQVALIEGPWGTGERTFLVRPEGDFIVFADAHNKRFKYADFYDNRASR